MTLALTTMPDDDVPTNQVTIACKECRAATPHAFLRMEPVPRGKAMIYGCTVCHEERRFGLLGPNELPDEA